MDSEADLGTLPHQETSFHSKSLQSELINSKNPFRGTSGFLDLLPREENWIAKQVYRREKSNEKTYITSKVLTINVKAYTY